MSEADILAQWWVELRTHRDINAWWHLADNALAADRISLADLVRIGAMVESTP